MAEKIIIFDTTLRDGEQSPGASLNIDEKLQIARQLALLQVDVIEAGFPFASRGDLEAVRTVAREVKGPQIAGLARAMVDDLDAAWEAVKEAEKPRIHTFISTSDIHLKYQMRKTREEVLEAAVAAVRYAKRYTPNVEFSAMDASRSDLDYVAQVFTAVIDAGATTVNFPDTVGYAIPHEFGARIKYLMEKIPNIDRAVLSVHCHNDLGLAVANSLAAIMNGARQVESTINGIGERAGNTSLEEVVMALATRKDLLDYYTDIVTQHIYPTSRLVSKLTGMIVQPNKAIVGANAFAHESGIHQDAVLKEASTFEIMTPTSIGIKKSTLPLGKLSGRHALKEKLVEMGYNLSEPVLAQVFARFKDLADRKKTVFDEDLESLVEIEVLRKSVPDHYRLQELVVLTGTMAKPSATVKMEVEGEIKRYSAFGDGPIDATFKAITNIAQSHCRLLKFSVNSITGGTDALGEITVRLEEDGFTVTGHGVDPDIVTASARALINGLNRLFYLKNMAKQPESDETLLVN
ncbi:MAG: 2-isopropylmalate synthase [Deltaproteobacteria bacterium]|nr:MAG: 2-isopropylmalate synthase [Deltaproteobacteria bacterium]